MLETGKKVQRGKKYKTRMTTVLFVKIDASYKVVSRMIRIAQEPRAFEITGLGKLKNTRVF